MVNMIITFRGQKMEMPLDPDMTLGSLRAKVAISFPQTSTKTKEYHPDTNDNDDDDDDPIHTKNCFSPNDIKLMYKGKVLTNNNTATEDDNDDDDDDVNLLQHLTSLSSSLLPKKTIKIMAMGQSKYEKEHHTNTFERDRKRVSSLRIRDDLTKEGQMAMIRNKRLGRTMLLQSKSKAMMSSNSKYGFGRIETLSGLPKEDHAHHILQTLANDVGIRACLAKHQWNVGCLAEMYPEGNVGESEVCIMGLNQNKGQTILLRLRTDDLQGFRKMLSIRQVLFHELAHNVYSEHDSNFFMLMRQIEKECNEWTSHGQSLGGSGGRFEDELVDDNKDVGSFVGGSGRLGGGEGGEGGEGFNHPLLCLPTRELTARAAQLRISSTKERIEEEGEEEGQCNCGQCEQNSRKEGRGKGKKRRSS